MKSLGHLVSYSALAAAVLVPLSAGTVAGEPAATCSCETSMALNVPAKGQLTDVQGDVFVSGPTGYAPAKAGQSVLLNSSVIVGPKGEAGLQFGQCKLSAPADSTAVISSTDQKVCINVVKTFEGTAEETAGFAGLDTAALTPFFVGVGSMGFGFVGLGVAVVEELEKVSD